jgi:hypothetical protein
LAALFHHCDEAEDGKGQEAAEECRRGSTDAGQLHEDG